MVPRRQLSAGIGQGYNAYTPLQLAHAIATVATDGVSYKPHLVKSIQNMRTGKVTRSRHRDPRTPSR